MRVAARWMAAAIVMTCLACGGEPPRPVVAMDLAELLADWKKNPLATSEKCAGKEIVLTGFIAKIGENNDGTTYVLLSTRNDGELQNIAQVFFSREPARQKLRECSVGAKVEIQAILPSQSSEWPRLTATDLRIPR